MKLKVIDEELSVCKVRDYSGVNLNQHYVFTGATDEEKSLVCPVSDVPENTIVGGVPAKIIKKVTDD